jgi:hypothetical protein
LTWPPPRCLLQLPNLPEHLHTCTTTQVAYINSWHRYWPENLFGYTILLLLLLHIMIIIGWRKVKMCRFSSAKWVSAQQHLVTVWWGWQLATAKANTLAT